MSRSLNSSIAKAESVRLFLEDNLPEALLSNKGLQGEQGLFSNQSLAAPAVHHPVSRRGHESRRQALGPGSG